MLGGLIALVILFMGAALIFPVEIKTRHSFICDVTGSRYGYTEWFFGGRTSNWYEKTELEKFVEEKHPTELQHRWSTQGNTGKDIFGRNIVFRCGPRPPLLRLSPPLIADYCFKASDKEKFETYQSLLHANRQEAENIADSILAKISTDFRAPPESHSAPTNPPVHLAP